MFTRVEDHGCSFAIAESVSVPEALAGTVSIPRLSGDAQSTRTQTPSCSPWRVWISSDDVLRTEGELLDEMMRELGFQRRGQNVVARLTTAISRSRR